MAVAINTTTAVAGFVGGGGGTSQSTAGTVTPTAGANGLLAFMLGYGDVSAPITGTASWDTSPLTPLATLAIDAHSVLYTFVANGAVVTGHIGARLLSFGVTYGASQGLNIVYAGGIFFTGVYQTTLADAFTSSNSGPITSASASISIPSATGSMVVGLGGASSGSAWTAAAGSPNTATEVLNASGFTPKTEAQYANGATTQTINATLTSALWGMLGVSINAAPLAPAGRPGQPRMCIKTGIPI